MNDRLFTGLEEAWNPAVIFLFLCFLFNFFSDFIRHFNWRLRRRRHLDLWQIKTGSNDCHDDRFPDLLVDCYAENDVDIIAGRFPDVFNRVVRVVNRNVRAAGNVDDRFLSAVDLSFQ